MSDPNPQKDQKKDQNSSDPLNKPESFPASGEAVSTEDRHEIAGLKAEIKILTERNNDILESISEAFFTLNKEWQFTYANAATGLLLARGPGSLYGKSIWDEYPGLIGSDFEPVYRGAMDYRKELRITQYYPDHRRFYEVNVFPASGGGVTVYFKDVSEREKAEAVIKELNERNRTILESITDGFFALDSNWNYTYVNPQAGHILEKDPDELIGRSVWAAYPGLIGSEFERVYRSVAEDGTTSTFTDYYPDHDRWYEINAYPASNGITVYFRDVSERVRTEKALRESDRRKDEFIATLAHELRNPLAPIRSGLEVIRRVGTDPLKFAETLDIIERQTNQIIHLVDDLLDISRITQGKIYLKKERIELKTALEIALETSRVLIEEAENELEITLPDEPVFIEADLTRIAQIFLNILNNAAKFSEPHGKISVLVSEKKGQVLTSIKDAGLGIAPGMISKIFDMFGQIETPERQERGGLGIGLNVVKKLAEMHGGSVEAFSEGLGKGSEFIVRLPLASARSGSQIASRQPVPMETPPVVENMSSGANADRRRILVVDDNEDALEMMEILLSMEGHTVRKALDSNTGLEIAEKFQPNICLCDIGLPGMNGYELALHLRELLPATLLISISGWGQPEDHRRSMLAGYDHHLVKPVQFDDLLELIQKQPPETA
jgi:PAS domain S-box-containing protein